MSANALKINFASLSLGASVDQQTGSLSVFDLLEEVRTPQLPVQIQSLVIAISLEKTDPAEFAGKMLIHLLTPDGKQHLIGNGDMRIPAEQKRMKAVFRYSGFPVNLYGSHRLVLSWLTQANQKVGEALLDFEVIQVAQPTQAAGAGDKSSSLPH